MDVQMKFLMLFLIFGLPAWSKWTVSTYNIRNFDKDYSSGATNIHELSRIIKEVKSDVMAFQEVVNKSAFVELMKKNLPDHLNVISNCGGFGKQHLALVYDTKKFEYLTHSEALELSGSEGKCSNLRPALFVTLKLKMTGDKYTFGVVHLKAGSSASAMEQRWQQYKKIQKLTETFQNHQVILLGDFNTTGHLSKDEDFRQFYGMLKVLGMTTTSEQLNCTNYWTGLPAGNDFIPSILDHIVIQDKNLTKVQSVKSLTHCAQLECRPATLEELGLSFKSVSDHCPVKVTLD
jgi:endonuclease/exonuclease/phosphatase family metal-dependent hydrolase